MTFQRRLEAGSYAIKTRSIGWSCNTWIFFNIGWKLVHVRNFSSEKKKPCSCLNGHIHVMVLVVPLLLRQKLEQLLSMVGLAWVSCACVSDYMYSSLQALDYLKRLDGYKDIGFLEQTIHEAYNKANGDWDQALDFLTQGRWELKYYDMYMCVTIISAGIANQMCHRCVIIHVLLCSHDSSCMSSLSRHYLLETDYSHLVCPGIIVSVMIVQFIGPTPDGCTCHGV